ncbi:MAG: hypothetical protein JWO94_671, partial [Verrucomicrobiaceae bacterium]|nr:hypothetical protein [Verrucomicrobiaceae bacterium]
MVAGTLSLAVGKPPQPPPTGQSSPAVSEAEAAPLREALVTQSWTWTNDGYPKGLNLRFWKNGAVSPLAGGPIMGIWIVKGPRRVTLQMGPTLEASLSFDNNLGSFSGSPTNIRGRPFAPAGPGPRKQAAVSMPVISSPGQARIEVVMSQADAITNAIFVPLNGPMPDPGPAISLLREDLLDEAALKPEASQEAYATALRLCQGWQSALAERRDRHSGFASTSPVGTDFVGTRKQTLGPGDYVRYVAELH